MADPFIALFIALLSCEDVAATTSDYTTYYEGNCRPTYNHLVDMAGGQLNFIEWREVHEYGVRVEQGLPTWTE